MSTATIGDLTFTYKSKTHQPIKEGMWNWIYNDVTLATGEKVSQISVEYTFVPTELSDVLTQCKQNGLDKL